MGLYDVLTNGEREAQVKCWDNELKGYTPGDAVPALDGKSSYSIALREGGYALIELGMFKGFADKPLIGEPICDKYGDWHTMESSEEFYGSSSDPFSEKALLRFDNDQDPLR